MVSINESQELVNRLIKDLDWKTDSSEIFNHLVEEVGEVARELRKVDSDGGLDDELADVLFLIFKLANKLDVDMESAFLRKFERVKKRFDK